jgi:hypothetical protein
MKHSYPTSESLKFFLQMIHNREMALPDFQRDWSTTIFRGSRSIFPTFSRNTRAIVSGHNATGAAEDEHVIRYLCLHC